MLNLRMFFFLLVVRFFASRFISSTSVILPFILSIRPGIVKEKAALK